MFLPLPLTRRYFRMQARVGRYLYLASTCRRALSRPRLARGALPALAQPGPPWSALRIRTTGSLTSPLWPGYQRAPPSATEH